MLTVSEISNTAETVSLDNTLEALTLGCSDDVNELAFLEHLDGQHFTVFFLVALLETAELGEVALRGGAGLGKMALHRLCGVRLFLLTKSQLDGLITILLNGSNLCYDTRTSFNNSARYLLTVGIKKTGHSNFLSY